MAIRYAAYAATENTVVPTIQRDYVQGADENAKKRDKFLKDLLDALLPDKEGKPFSLDFIYGSQSTVGEDVDFQPIDGQQRLTTLALLGWVLSRRTGYAEALPIADIALTYRTRNSSENFCRHLFSHSEVPKDQSLSEYITTVPLWFAESWLNDPTVEAMLQMLDRIDNMLKEAPYKNNREAMAQLFFDPEKCPIMFERPSDMDNYRFTEDLYIKLNARGKELTDFEILKAEIINLLRTHFEGVTYEYGSIDGVDSSPDIPTYFEYAIEHQWSELFWKYALEDYKAEVSAKENTDERPAYPVLDEYFMRFFNHFTEMIFAEQHELEKISKWLNDRWPDHATNPSPAEVFTGKNGLWTSRNTARVYRKRANVEALFRTLDLWSDIQDNADGIAALFDKFFFVGNVDDSTGRINLFAGTTDLFRALISEENGLPLWGRYLLRGVERALLTYGKYANATVTDFIRIYWGILQGVNQRENSDLTVSFNLRLDDAHSLVRNVDKLLEDSSVNPYVQLKNLRGVAQEKDKGAFYGSPQFEDVKVLCNHEWLRWSFANVKNALTKLRDDGKPAGVAARRIADLYAMSDLERARVLIGLGFDGLNTKSYNWTYGGEGCWPYMFATDNAATFRDSITNFIINNVIDKVTPLQFDKYDYRYYALKYDDFLKSSPKYVLFFDNDFSLWALKNATRGGYNPEPYSYVVLRLLDASFRERFDAVSFGEGSSHGRLWLRTNGMSFECVKNGWQIHFTDEQLQSAIYAPLPLRFKVEAAGDELTIVDTEGHFKFAGTLLLDFPYSDRIQTAVEFLKTFDVN